MRRDSGKTTPSSRADRPRGNPETAARPPARVSVHLWAVAIAAIALLLFLPARNFQFTSYDDGAYILNNQHLRSLDGLRRIWLTGESEQYYPLTFSSFWVEFQLYEAASPGGGLAPRGYHLTNVVLHAINTGLLVIVLAGLGLPRRAVIVAGVLFAVHPAQVMTVAWVAERKNLLSCFFVLLTIAAWGRMRRRESNRWHLVAGIAFLAAVLAKTAVLTLPAALVLLDRLLLGRSWRSAILRAAPLAAASVAFALVTMRFETSFLDDVLRQRIPGLLDRVLIAAAASWWYGLFALVPWRLTPMHPIWNTTAADWYWWLPLAAALVCAAMTVRMMRRRGKVADGAQFGAWAAWGTGLFLVLILPTLGLIPFGNFSVTYVSEHFLYTAIIGLFVAIGVGCDRLAAALVGSKTPPCVEPVRAVQGRPAPENRRKLAPDRTRPTSRPSLRRVVLIGLFFAAAAVYAWATRAYMPVYATSEAMWARALETHPECFVAAVGLARARADQGRLREALELYDRAERLIPEYTQTYVEDAQVRLRLGDAAGAEHVLGRALRVDPRCTAALFVLADLAAQGGRLNEALDIQERALAHDPGDAQAHVLAAALRLRIGRYDRALEAFDAAARLMPTMASAWLGAAQCRRSLGRHHEAVAVLQEGLRHAPNDVALMHLLARLRATSPEDGLRDGVEAVRLAEAACRLTRFADPQAIDTLAAAHAEAGRFGEAASFARQAAQVAAAQGDGEAAAAFAVRAAQFAAGRPLREAGAATRPADAPQ